MGKPDKRLKKILLIMGITGAVYGTFRYLLPLVVPFLLAWGIALLLRPSAAWLAARSRVALPEEPGRRSWNRPGGRVRCGAGAERRFGKKLYRRFRRFLAAGVPVGLIGMGEFLALLVLLLAGLYAGGVRLCREMEMFVKQAPLWAETAERMAAGLCGRMERSLALRPGCLVQMTEEMLSALTENLKSAAMPYLMVNSLTLFQWAGKGFVVSVILFMAVGLFLQEMEDWKRRCVRSRFGHEYALIGRRLALMAHAYLWAQGILLLLMAAVCVAGLWLLGNPYCILAGIGLGILDALPVLGSGVVLIPWALLCFFRGDWQTGLGLLVICLVCYFLREYLEAKLMGGRMGLTPLETLISMYVGLKLFGLWGLFLGPVGLLLIEDLVKDWEAGGV